MSIANRPRVFEAGSSTESNASVSLSEGSYSIMDEPELTRRISSVLEELDETLNGVELRAKERECVREDTNGLDSKEESFTGGTSVGSTKQKYIKAAGNEDYSNPNNAEISNGFHGNTIEDTSKASVIEKTTDFYDKNELTSDITEHESDVSSAHSDDETGALVTELKHAIDKAIIVKKERECSDTQGASLSQHNLSTECPTLAKENNNKTSDNSSKDENNEDSKYIAIKSVSSNIEKAQISDFDSENDTRIKEAGTFCETGTQMDPEELETLSRGGFFAAMEQKSVLKSTDLVGTERNEDKAEQNMDGNKQDAENKMKENVYKIELNFNTVNLNQIGKSLDNEATENMDISEQPTTGLEPDPDTTTDIPSEGEPEVRNGTNRRKVHFGSSDDMKERIEIRLRSSSDEYVSASTDDKYPVCDDIKNDESTNSDNCFQNDGNGDKETQNDDVFDEETVDIIKQNDETIDAKSAVNHDVPALDVINVTRNEIVLLADTADHEEANVTREEMELTDEETESTEREHDQTEQKTEVVEQYTKNVLPHDGSTMSDKIIDLIQQTAAEIRDEDMEQNKIKNECIEVNATEEAKQLDIQSALDNRDQILLAEETFQQRGDGSDDETGNQNETIVAIEVTHHTKDVTLQCVQSEQHGSGEDVTCTGQISCDTEVQHVICIEPVLPKSEEKTTELDSSESSPALVKSPQGTKAECTKEKGFFKQVKEKLKRHFTRQHSDSESEHNAEITVRNIDIPPEFQDSVCHSETESDDSDDSERWGEWNARQILSSDDDDFENLSDLSLEENMTYPEELAAAIERYRRNDKTRLSRVKISRYNATLDMYVPHEYAMTRAILKRHAEKPDAKEIPIEDEKFAEKVAPGEKPTENIGLSLKDDITMDEPDDNFIPYQRGDRISELIDIYKYQIKDFRGKVTEDFECLGDTESFGEGNSEKLDSISTKSETSLYKTRSHDSDSLTSKEAMSERNIEVRLSRKSRGSFTGSLTGSAMSRDISIRSHDDRTANSRRGSSFDTRKSESEIVELDTEMSEVDTKVAEVESDVAESVLLCSQSCDDLDIIGRSRRGSSLRRRLSKRLSRAFSVEEKEMLTDDQTPKKKKGWFLSLPRLKGNKLKKSQSMSVLSKHETPSNWNEGKSKEKKRKDGKVEESDTEHGGKLKKSKSILSLNRFRGKDKKTKTDRPSDSDTENEAPKKKYKKADYDSDMNDDTPSTKSKWRWRKNKSYESDTDTEIKLKEKKQKKEKKKAKRNEGKAVDRPKMVDNSKIADGSKVDTVKPEVKRVLAKGYVSASSGDESVGKTNSKAETKKSKAVDTKGSDKDSIASSKSRFQKADSDVEQTENVEHDELKGQDSSSDNEAAFKEKMAKLKTELLSGNVDGKKKKGTEADVSDAESSTGSKAKDKKYASVGRSVGRKVTKYDSDDNDGDRSGTKLKRVAKKPKINKDKDKPKDKSKSKGVKRSTSKQNVNEIEPNPKYSLEKVVRAITMCSADIL